MPYVVQMQVLSLGFRLKLLERKRRKDEDADNLRSEMIEEPGEEALAHSYAVDRCCTFTWYYSTFTHSSLELRDKSWVVFSSTCNIVSMTRMTWVTFDNILTMYFQIHLSSFLLPFVSILWYLLPIHSSFIIGFFLFVTSKMKVHDTKTTDWILISKTHLAIIPNGQNLIVVTVFCGYCELCLKDADWFSVAKHYNLN